MERPTAFRLSKYVCVLWIIAELFCGHTNSTPSFYNIYPRYGSIAGGTLLRIRGSGFSSDQYNSGNEVYLIGSENGGQYPCILHKLGTTQRQIMCYTIGNIPLQRYYFKVVVDGNVVPDSSNCRTDHHYWDYNNNCLFSPISSYTPTLTSLVPQSGVRGDLVTIGGQLLTDRYESNRKTASNGRTQRIQRVYVGPTDCELKKGDKLYGLALEGSYRGQLKCRIKSSSIGFYNASFTVETPYGRSLVSSDLYRLSYKDDIYLYQIYSKIASLSAHRGSTAGGLKLKMYCPYVDGRAPYLPPTAKVGGVECAITNVVLDEYLECIVPAKPQHGDSRFIGNRGVNFEYWTSTTVSDLDDILELSSSSPGYVATNLDETYYIETEETLDNYVSKITTYFTPPHSGRYTFQLSSNYRARLWMDGDNLVTSTNGRSSAQPVVLMKGQRYLLEIVHQALTDESYVLLGALFFETHLNNAQLDKASNEKQTVRITSKKTFEEQELTFSNFTDQSYNKEIQVVNISTYGQFRFGLYGVYTEPLDVGSANSIRTQQALNGLPVFTSDEYVTVQREDTTNGVLFTFTFESKRGDFPDIEVLTAPSTEHASYSVQEIAKGSTHFTAVTLTFAGRVSDPFSVTSLTQQRLSSVVNNLFEARCPEEWQSSADVYLDYEKRGHSSGTYSKETEAFCGRYTLKNPNYIYSGPKVSVSVNTKLCFAYKGILRDVVDIYFYYQREGLPHNYYKRHRLIHYFSKDSNISSSSWYYVCFDLYDVIENSLPNMAAYQVSRIDVRKGTPQDIFIDSLFIGSRDGPADEDITLRRLPPAMPNGFLIKSETVEMVSSGVFKITLEPYNCGNGFPLFQLTNGQVTTGSVSRGSSVATSIFQNGGSIHVERIADASPPTDGLLDITFNGTTKHDLNISLSADDIQRELETIANIGSLTVTKTGDCHDIRLAVQFDSLPGDLPEMSVPTETLYAIQAFDLPLVLINNCIEVHPVDLSGVDVSHSIYTDVNGNFNYDPLPGDMLSTVHSKPQVSLSVNGVPMACGGDCSFDWENAATPTVTGVSPTSGGFTMGTTVLISGSGFSLAAEDNHVTIGGVECTVTSVTDETIRCGVGDGPIGQHSVIVTVSDKGLGVYPEEEVVFEYTGSITRVSPTSGSIGGGLILTITGNGFKSGADVVVNSKSCDVLSTSSGEITCMLPMQTTGGTYSVSVISDQGTMTREGFTYDPLLTPIVTTVLPSVISVSGGSVTILGSGFGSAKGSVNIGDTSATVLSWTQTSAVVHVGHLNPGTQDVTVGTETGNALLSNYALPTVEVDLRITSVYPLQGSVAGGTNLTITGSGFGTNVSITNVTVGKVPCDISAMNNTRINCLIANTAKLHHITNKGTHKAFGIFYAFDEPYAKINLGDTVQWSWQTHELVNGVNYAIIEVESLHSFEAKPGGFSSGQSSRNGNFRHQFMETGTFYVWSGFVDEYIIKNFYGTIEVVDIPSTVGEINVKVYDKSALHRIEGSANPVDISSCQAMVSAKTGCSDALPSGGNSDKFMFAFWTCSTPIVHSITPTNGTIKTAINLQGEGFSSTNCQNEISIGASLCIVATSSDTSITCHFERSGTPELNILYPVTVRIANLGYAIMQKTKANMGRFAPIPNIDNINPVSGSLAGESIITVSGFGFDATAVVEIDGYACEVLSINFVEIQCLTPPPLSEGTKHLSVIVSVSNFPFKAICETQWKKCEYTYASELTPFISAINPTSASGPTTLIISGSRLGSVRSDLNVTIGTLSATVESAADSEIKIKVDNVRAGSNSVVVRRKNYGKATGSVIMTGLANITSVFPSSGSINGGQSVTIAGTGFVNGQTTVTLDGTICEIKTINFAEVVFLTPAHPHSSVVLKVVSNYVHYDEQTYTYNASISPTINSVTPNFAIPGTSLAIIGSNFGDDTPVVLLGDVPCNVTFKTHSEIRCIAGYRTMGRVPVYVYVNKVGASNTNKEFNYHMNWTSISPSQGSTAGGQIVTLMGSVFSPLISVSVCNNNNRCSFVRSTSTEYVCETSPWPAQLCDVMIYHDGVATVKNGVYTYNDTLTSTIASVTPSRGGTGGGTPITITGSGFGSSLADAVVTIANSECVIKTLTDTVIICETGSHHGSIKSNVHVNIKTNGIGFESSPGCSNFEYIDVWSSNFTWGGGPLPAAGEIVVIQAGQTILLDTDTPVIKAILIQGGKLIFDESDLALNAEIIMITDGGLLQVGTEDAPFQHKAIITLHGHVRSKELPIYGTKVIIVRNGTLDLHGKIIPVTWTYLSATANVGSYQITLADSVEWTIGDEIVIAATGNSQNENEQRRITAISGDKRTLTFDLALDATHVGTQETFDGTVLQFRAEVGLLTHNVVVRGSSNTQWEDKIEECEPGFDTGENSIQTCFQGRHGDEMGSDQFGAMIIVHSPNTNTHEATAKISYTEITFAGQAYRLGRYSVYFHLNGDMSTSYIKGCSIHHTFNRALDLQGVHNTIMEHTVIYNIMGSAVFLEDGIETGNILQYNMAVFVRQSTSLQNDDIMAAAFWVRHPNNTIRHNAVAGGTHFGFWYYPLYSPIGPSHGTYSVCGTYQPLGVFLNNSAHSFGWYGLWISPDYYPHERPCSYPRYQVAPAIFRNFFAWNNEKGAEFYNGGSLQFDNLTVVANRKVGFEGFSITCAPLNSEERPMIRNSLIIGNTTVLSSSEQGYSNIGVLMPKGFGFHLRNVRFVNFANQSTALSLRNGDLRERNRYITEQLFFVNSPNRGLHTFEMNGALVDKDGTLIGTPSFQSAIPTIGILPSSCESGTGEFSNGVPYSKCSSNNRFPIYSITESSFRNEILTLENKYGKTSVPYDGQAWRGYLLSGETYNITFENAVPIINISMTIAFYDFEETDFIFIQLVMRELPDRVSVDGGQSSRMPSIGPLNPVQANHGDWEWLNKERKVKVLLRGAKRSSTTMSCDYDISVRLKIYKCFYKDCEAPPDPSSVPPASTSPLDPYYWHDDGLWVDTKDGYITADKNRNGTYGIPRKDDNVRIPVGMWVVIDEEPLQRMGTLLINGVLEVKDVQGLHYELTAIYIVILGGRLIAGWPDAPFHKAHLSIILRGRHSTDVFLKWHDTYLGPRAIAVYGGLDLFGKEVGLSWTQLAVTAYKGTKVIVLKEPVTWTVGDEIVIGPTTYDVTQTEIFTIKSVAADNVTLTLDRKLQYTHIAHSETFDIHPVVLAAPVGHISRTITIKGEEHSNLLDESKGARIITGIRETPENTQKGYARLSNVEFSFTGQNPPRNDEDDPLLSSLAYVNTGTVSDVKPSFARKCSFKTGFNTAIRVVGANNLNLTDNVIYDVTGSGVRSDSNNTRIINNLIVLVRPISTGWQSGIDALTATHAVIQNNLVTAAMQIAIRAPPLECGDLSGRIYNNTVQANVIGFGILRATNSPVTCVNISGITAWKNHAFGIYYQGHASVKTGNNKLIENGNGIVTFVIGPDSEKHIKGNKTVEIDNTLVVGTTSSFSCESDMTKWKSSISHLGVAIPASRQPKKLFGVVFPNFMSGYNNAPFKPLIDIETPPAIAGLMTLTNVTFANYGPKYCPQSYAIATNNGNDDGQHPVESRNITLVDVDDDYKIFYHRPNVEKVNPGECVDMDCDGLKKTLFKDLDGTFLGSVGTVIPQSEFEWDGDSRRGLGDYRIPTTMVTALNGTRIPYDIRAPNKGIIRSNNCTYSPAWQAYKCFGYNYEMLVMESMDSDSLSRRISPVALLSQGYVDLINGPQDHTFCRSYTCRRRLSTFLAIIATGFDVLVHFTGTTPRHMRYHLLNVEPNQGIKLTVWYASPSRLDVYVDGTYVISTNSEINSKGYYVSKMPVGNEFTPVVDNTTGTNYFDRLSGQLSVIIKGPAVVDVRTANVIIISFGLPAMSVDDFYGANLVENVASFFNIPLTKVRVVNIVRATGIGRRKRSSDGLSVDLEIGNEPSSEFTENSTTSDSSDREAILNMTAQALNECQIGNISETLGMETSCTSITSPASTAGYETITYTPQTVSHLVFIQEPTSSYEGNHLHNQPNIQVLDVSNVVITDLGTTEYPWQLTVGIRPGTGNPDAVLTGQTTINASNSWFNFTELAITHMGSGYVLDFNISYPEVESQFSQSSSSFDVKPRIVKANALTMASGDLQSGVQFDAALDLRDSITDQTIPKINWRNHSWDATAALLGTPQFGTINGQTTASFNHTTGLCTFNNLSISYFGFYYIQFRIESSPVEYNFTVNHKVWIRNPDFVGKMPDTHANISVKFDVDYDTVLPDEDAMNMFDQYIMENFTNEFSGVEIQSSTVQKGSIVVTFSIAGNQSDVSTVALALCDNANTGTSYSFNGYSLSLAEYMTYNNQTFYGVSCYKVNDDDDDDDSLSIAIIAGIAVGSALLLAITAGIIVWKVFMDKAKQRIDTADASNVNTVEVCESNSSHVNSSVPPRPLSAGSVQMSLSSSILDPTDSTLPLIHENVSKPKLYFSKGTVSPVNETMNSSGGIQTPTSSSGNNYPSWATVNNK